MQFIAQYQSDLFQLTAQGFTGKSLAAFRYQAAHNALYREFLQLSDITPGSITTPEEIPFLPAELFKTRKVISGDILPEHYFESSGTTGQINARHYVTDLDLYTESILNGFNLIYGDPAKYSIIGLLPSYLERKNASLVYMVHTLMQKSNVHRGGFFLNEWEQLQDLLMLNEKKSIPTFLIGVSFALQDMAEKIPMPLHHTIMMETGGMKGRRKEITRIELHAILKDAFQLQTIHSEYGMTELLSQAYSKGEGIFYCPPWMKILVRDPEDPFSILPVGATGCLNIIDLANIHSCCFIATMDLGKLHADGSFEVSGRYAVEDVRGCNLMVDS